MAEFDPALQPLNDPTFTRDSRGVDVPRTPGPEGVATNQIMPRGVDTPDRSAEYEGKAAGFEAESRGASLKGLGDLFAGIVGIGDFAFKAGDALIKKELDRQIYDTSKREQEAEITRLETLLGGKGTRSIFDANAQMSDEDMPSDLQDLPDTVQRYKEASAASGPELRDHYAGIVHREAKNLRARYPQYAEYIDEKFKAFTGMDPANARIRAMSAQINSAQTSARQQQNKAMSEVLKRAGYANNGINSTQAAQLVQSGQWKINDVMQWAYKGDRLDTTNKEKIQKFQVETGDRAAVAQRAQDAAFSFLASESENLTQNIMAGFQVKDTEELRMKLKEDRPQKWWQDRVVELEVGRDMFEKKMFQALTAGGNKSIAVGMNMKPNEVRAYIKSFNTEYDSVIESVRNKDANGIAGAVNRINAKTDESIEFILKDPKLKDFALIGAASKKIWGDNSVIAAELTERLLQENYPGKFKEVMRAHSNWISTGASVPGAAVPSYNQSFEELRSRGVLTPTGATTLINKVSAGITDPKVSDEEKYSLAISAFGERNLNFISNLKPDFVGDDGKRVQGQWGVFQKWTGDGVAKEVKRLDAKHPGLWNQYVNWAEKTMTQNLLPSEIATLNQLDRESNFNVEWKISNNGVRELRLISSEKPGEDFTNRNLQRNIAGGKLPREKELESVVARVNSAVYRYSNIAKESGQDADAFILRSLHNGGLLRNTGDLQGTFSNKLLQAIKNSRIKTESQRQ